MTEEIKGGSANHQDVVTISQYNVHVHANMKILECRRRVNLKAREEVLGSILAFSDAVKSGGRQMHHC